MENTVASKTQKPPLTEYERPKSGVKLTKPQREALLEEYFSHYRDIAKHNPELLNQKLPREISKDLLGAIGALLLEQTKSLAENHGPVKDFLDLNAPPPSLEAPSRRF